MIQQPPRPSRRGKRPSALDISFGTSEDTDESATTSDASRKRNRDDPATHGGRASKRLNLDLAPQPVHKYEPRKYEVPETKDLILFGEEPDPPDDGKKRTRFLSRFAFFDARHGNSMISLDVLSQGVGGPGDHQVLGAGFVVPRYELDEDEGQEDGLDEEVDRQYIRLSCVRRFFTRYWEANSPSYIETDHAIYELDVLKPSKKYRSHFRPFWKVQGILRFVISSAANDAEQEVHAFMREYKRLEVLGESLTEQELWAVAKDRLDRTIEMVPYDDNIRGSIVVRHLLQHLPPVIFQPVGKGKVGQGVSMRDFRVEYKGNLDLAVLDPKIPTHVTPRIARLALGLFREKLHVVGPRPRVETEPAAPKEELTLRLKGFLMHARSRRLVQFRSDQRIGRSRLLKYILIDGVKYDIGDTVLFYSGQGIPPNPDNIPPTDTLADHFWFGKIIYINGEHETVHVQWFEHSSKAAFPRELGNSQELFLVDHCDTQLLKHIIGKVNAHYIKPGESLAGVKPHDYFYRYMWDESEGKFTDIDLDALAASAREPPPDNCLPCWRANKFEEDTGPNKIHLGVRWHGVDYHLDDSVLIKADEGPCHVGHIIEFRHDDQEVKVRLFGRIDRLRDRPQGMLKDERHLFYTDDEMTVVIDDLIGICYVIVKEDMPDLEAWLAMSPHHFYVRYRFPSLIVDSWHSRRRMRWKDLAICGACMKANVMKVNGMKAFLQREAPLRVFDPFAGTGSFALAMEELGCFKLTHAAEISPSAAKTLRRNASPDVKIYNQCSNLVLRHAILTHENKNPEPLRSIEGRPLPALPKPGDIDCLITGFPCQPHSTLNMYQKASDRKSNLILTALSFVDHFRPSYCIFENVRGFLQHRLRARQHNKHVVKGGIDMGGLKLVTAALLDMGYQFRFALLQSAHYGTPQSRVRFFLIAAKCGMELPQFPQPTHDFPASDALEIKFPEGLTLQPITTLSGVAPHRSVSVYDAIGDLPKFDWKNPKEDLSRREMGEKRIKECRIDQPWCGYQGPDIQYEHDPQTRFQQTCRRRPTQDIQQYTRTYDPQKVERVVKIPVCPDADYRSLPPGLWEYQFAHPASASGKSGYRQGYYGRLDGNGWFRTTVTNVDPMAKQCRVIHPVCKRIVTVRELARSQGFPDHFVFHADHKHVKTMHRQIGNAVPWQVSVAIAHEFRETLYKNWVKSNPIDEPVEEEFSSDDEAMEVD